MKKAFLLLFSFYSLSIFANESITLKVNPTVTQETQIGSPLAEFSSEWNKEKYKVANTAAHLTYLSQQEKEVIYVLNLARTYPALFFNTVVKKYPELINSPSLKNSSYYKSLEKTMTTMKPVGLLQPDSLLFNSAYFHAKVSGEKSYVGHQRQDTKSSNEKYFMGECCEYGTYTPADIVIRLLIDEGIPSLGHRKILLDGEYKKVGVSQQPHKSYQVNTVIDLFQ